MPDTTKIVTSHVFPPIPDRSHDWCAVREGYEPDDTMGWGETESVAIADLLSQEADFALQKSLAIMFYTTVLPVAKKSNNMSY